MKARKHAEGGRGESRKAPRASGGPKARSGLEPKTKKGLCGSGKQRRGLAAPKRKRALGPLNAKRALKALDMRKRPA